MAEDEVARLYREHGYFLFRRCLAYLGEPAAADDAVQEVFVRALKGVQNYRGDAAPRTWLCRIADHLCVDLLRRRRRNPVQASLSDLEPELAMGPCVLADERDTLIAAHRLIEQLEPESQRLVLLYYVDEMTQDELAQELGVSRRTIGKRLQALLARARMLLGSEEAS